jgi:hypothetical protein
VEPRSDRTNGFRVRGLNADTDKLAVQSNRQTTFFLTRSKWRGMLPKWHEIGIAKNELIVLRPYGGAPMIELEALGGPYGVLIVNATQSCTRTLRVGQRLRLGLKTDESVVIRCEDMVAPDGTQVRL